MNLPADLLIVSKVGTNDLRAHVSDGGGFNHVVLEDADDGDVIVVNEDDVRALRDYLTRVLEATGG